METLKDTLAEVLRNRYVVCAFAFLAIVGPGIVRLARILESVRQ